MQARLERHPYGRAGWRFVFSPLARGRGYMAYVFPWHSRNVASPRWRQVAWLSYIPGFTLTAGTRGREIRSRRLRRFYVQIAKKGNTQRDCVPQWW